MPIKLISRCGVAAEKRPERLSGSPDRAAAGALRRWFRHCDILVNRWPLMRVLSAHQFCSFGTRAQRPVVCVRFCLALLNVAADRYLQKLSDNVLGS